MPKISNSCLKQVKDALEQYEQEVEAAELQKSTKRTYLQHAKSFVRWLDDGFKPGAKAGGD